ncbi:MAG: tetratricopeptide repeat protein [Anaerolineae bacterium]|nr:tetratricopeptide repeat protein [Anaerolineae bacterium]
MSSLSKWQEIRQRQGKVNAERWLNLLESDSQPAQLVLQEYDNLLRAIEQMLEYPETFDLAYHLLDALFTYANSYADWDRWLIYLQEAHHVSQSLQKKSEEASLLEMMAYIHRNQGALKEAQTYLNQALAIYQELTLVSEQATTLSNLAVVLEILGQDGLNSCQTALVMATECKDEQALVVVMINLSQIYLRRHEWQACVLAAQTALDLACQLKNPILETRALFNMLTGLGYLGKWDEINDTFPNLADDLVKRGDTHTLAKLRNNLGGVAFRMKNWQEAEKQWQEALNLQSVLQDPMDQAFLYNNLGKLYTQTSELETAREMLQRAITLQDQLQDIYHWANALDNLAEVYEAEGNTAVPDKSASKHTHPYKHYPPHPKFKHY